MAYNSLYASARTMLLKGELLWLTDKFMVQLLDAGVYSTNADTAIATHTTMADIPAGALIGSAVEITGKTISTDGAAAAANVTIPAVAGATAEYVLIYKEVTPGAATNPLILLFNVATGLPATPNGGDIIVTWDAGINKVFRP